MEHVNILREYGLFDAKVPRYTSYPPANRFEAGIGARVHGDWLRQVPAEAPVSLYVHIPFCRRLCWFCACRTQGTKTMQPVEAYVEDLIREIDMVRAQLQRPPPMARLHFGGGTPTLLTVDQMTRLIDAIDRNFARAPGFEFSVEIDPTEAAPNVLALLAEKGMRRASIGVQDFEPKVQDAIGRQQSYEQTKHVIDQLRELGVQSLNIDLLYGLPYQSLNTLQATLRQVHDLRPDRLALYGYAHVPHVSKRQVMIPDDALPSTLDRFEASGTARKMLIARGYEVIGIDHFALRSDSLAKAAQTGQLKRNFQGYTDDPCATLIGFGASAISKFPQGYVQNAVATAAYQDRVRHGRFAGHKGYVMRPEDALASDVVDGIMCQGEVNLRALREQHPHAHSEIHQISRALHKAFPKALEQSDDRLRLTPQMTPLARIVAARVDAALETQHMHSAAI